MQLPREVIVGTNVLGKIGEMCKGLGFHNKIIVVTGPNVYKIISNSIDESLIKENFDMDYVIINESTKDYVELVEEKIDKIKPEVILGAGGGKDIDVAKQGAANCNTPFISIPTAASHDGIASSHASIKGFKQPFSKKNQAPIAIIADLDLIIKSPYRLIASGCGDVIAKYTAIKDWELAKKIKDEYYGDYAANLALMSAKLVTESANEIRTKKEDAYRTVVEALISCGVAMSIAGSSRPCSGSEHLFAHALDSLIDNNALHGEKCAVGTILCSYLQKGNWKMVRRVLRVIGTPVNAEELDLDSDVIVKALLIAPKIRPDRYTILNSKKLNKRKAEEITKITKVVVD